MVERVECSNVSGRYFGRYMCRSGNKKCEVDADGYATVVTWNFGISSDE